jgi:hypothetical protein
MSQEALHEIPNTKHCTDDCGHCNPIDIHAIFLILSAIQGAFVIPVGCDKYALSDEQRAR